MTWYNNMKTTTTCDFCFTKSARGSSSSRDRSPFSKDKKHLIQFKSWVCSNLDNLTVFKAIEWINDKILSERTASKLKYAHITYPVKPNVVSGWMNKAGFRYAAYKKLYYVDQHKASDVVEDQERYLKRKFEDKLEEQCWF